MRRQSCFRIAMGTFTAVTCSTFAALAPAADWAASVRLPRGETSAPLFNGRDFDGWEGQTEKYFSIAGGAIRAANSEEMPVSTYLFTRKSYRDFRLLLEVKQTLSPKHSTMHSAVAALGEKFEDRGEAYSFRGPLLMFCHDWGVWDANRRNRVYPPAQKGAWLWQGERAGEWNEIEILVLGNRIRMAANGQLVMDFEDDAKTLQESPIGLQLHANKQPQEFHFRGLLLVEKPTDRFATLSDTP